MTILQSVLLGLAIAVFLFFGLLKYCGWAHYHRWTFFITKTEARLSGPWLDKYLHYHGGMCFLTAAWLFMCYFEILSPYSIRTMFILVFSWVRAEFHFKRVADGKADVFV